LACDAGQLLARKAAPLSVHIATEDT